MNSRVEKLRILLREQNLDAVFISSLPNITYLTHFSGFGTEDRDGFLLITKKHQYIFTHGIYTEAVEKEIKEFTLIPMQRENPLNTAIKTLIDKHHIKQMGFESFDLKVNEYERLIKTIDKKILFATDLISTLRMIKTTEEIKAIQKSCELGDEAFTFILKTITAGITEKELETELEFFIKRHGADLTFSPVVAFGPNASKPHHVPTDQKLQHNSLILFDFGVKLDNYCSDMSRTVCFGKVSPKQKNVYQTVLESQNKAIDFLQRQLVNKKHIVGKEVDAISRDYLIQKRFASLPHSLGHGIGLECHEAPRLTIVSDEIIKNGMVFSIEPGIYLPDEMGVRIEDLFAVQNNKLKQLTHAPRELIEISSS